METSIFTDKGIVPDNPELRIAIGSLYDTWMEIRDFAFESYTAATEEWNFPGAKYGWSFRIKDKKRAIVYLLPRDKYFLVALVFGEKATKMALASDIVPEIKKIIESARVYAEGRGFSIEIRDVSAVEDIKKLIKIKLT